MIRRSVCVLAVVLSAAVAARESGAGVITFDAGIAGTQPADDPGDPFDNCVGYCIYDSFTTQGFTFTAVPNGGAGDFGELVVVDPTLLPGIVDNGTDYLLAGGIVAMTRSDATPFSLSSFSAAQIDPNDPTLASIVRVFGLKGGVFFQSLQFDLTQGTGFQVFSLPATWTDLSAVRISGRRTFDNSASPWGVAVDNITVGAAVPEPASLLLLGMGALGWVARARRRAASVA